MKVEKKNALIALLLVMMGGGSLFAEAPETTDLREPMAIRVVNPAVPYPFARYGIKGSVEVVFRLDSDGIPRDIEVETASHPEYAESVENALRSWRFEEPVVADMKFRLPVLFN
jgi:TonB family protein